VKTKKVVSAIRKTLGFQIILSAAFITPDYAQSTTPRSATAPASASGAVSSTPSGATSSTANGGVTTLHKVEVTGSLIKSSDKVGFNQVQTITAKEIQSSGATTVSDFLRDASANSSSSFADNEPGFAPGGAGIALRGLSEKYTLVLVDGQRVAPYGLAVNATDSFFDVNAIPLNMVERIEIVKTGAVSQYGSDAIAGVVNIITKKDFQGVQLGGSFGGATSGGDETKKFDITAGVGDLNADRFNVTLGASIYQQNGYSLADRSQTSGQNYLNQPFGVLDGAADYFEPNGRGNGGAWKGNCPPGSFIAPGASVVHGPASGSSCVANTASGYSGEPDSLRLNAKLHATFQLNDQVQAFADLWESRDTTTLDQGYSSIGDGTSAYDPVTGGVKQIPNTLSGGNNFNPYKRDIPINYTFLGQPISDKSTANFSRAATGIKGSFATPTLGDWDWSASVSHSQSTVDSTLSGLMSTTGLQSILGAGGLFDFSNPALTPDGLNGLYTSADQEAISKLDTVDLTASTADLFSLPAGNVGLGFGAQFMHQSEYITPFSTVGLGQAIPDGLNLQSVDGGRNVAAVYYQIDVPLVTHLTFSQSGRYDHYSDFGGAYSPRFALRWQPVSMLTAYASYDRGFRAPTLIENSQSSTYGVQFAADPHDPNHSTQPQAIIERQNGNPDLQPERTKNYNLGFQLSPDAKTDFGFDWYKIVIGNVIGEPDIQAALNANDKNVVVRNPNGTISYLNSAYENLSALRTDGFESTFRKTVSTNIGSFTLSGDWAYVWHFNVEDTSGLSVNCAGNDACSNQPFGASFPRWKGNLTLDWNYRKFDTALSYLYSSPYTMTEQGLTPDSVASYSQFNLTGTYTGFKHWTVYASIDNLFNRMPPFDPLYQTPSYGVPYDPSLYDNVGRFAEVGATYRF